MGLLHISRDGMFENMLISLNLNLYDARIFISAIAVKALEGLVPDL